MPLRFRRILYIFFIIAFLIITPMVSLYATGYKFKLNWPPKLNQTIQKTGMFVFDTEPQGAKIYLNNKSQQLFLRKYFSPEKSHITTPAKIKNLLPEEYNVKLEKEGYWPWQKKLTIYPGNSTFTEDVYLFKKDLPWQITSGLINKILFSPNKEYIVLVTKKDLTLLNLGSEEQKIFAFSTSSPFAAPNTSFSYSWSPDNKKILLNNTIFNVDNWEEPIDLSKLTDLEASNFKWDSSNENVIYYSEKNAVYYYDQIDNSSKAVIANQQFSDYLIKDNLLFLINHVGKSANLNVWTIDEKKLIRNINLPFSPHYYFLNPGHDLINLYDKNHQILYLIDPLLAINPLRETISNVKYTYWISNDKLLYANDFEIWLLDLKDNRKDLLTRISQTINSIIWHPSNNYVIYSTDQEIYVIELDIREKRNITKLIKLNTINWTQLNNQGDTLYFYAKIGNQEGLYKLAIQ